MPIYYPGPIPPDIPNRKASVTATWLREIKQALHDMQYLAYQLYGGQEGVLAEGATPANSMLITVTSPPSLRVTSNSGTVVGFETVIRKRTSGVLTAEMPAPVSNPMIYLVQFSFSTQLVSIKAGAEAASPATPNPDTNCIPLATVYMRVGATSIEATDDAVNGYLTDARNFVN